MNPEPDGFEPFVESLTGDTVFAMELDQANIDFLRNKREFRDVMAIAKGGDFLIAFEQRVIGREEFLQLYAKG